MGLKVTFAQLLVAVVVSWVLFLVTLHYFNKQPTHHHHLGEREAAAGDAERKTRLTFVPFNGQQHPAIPIHIVEEHHEVLIPWYESAKRGIIPTFGNTIFHIDGHPDNAAPPFKDLIPFNAVPENLQAIRGMMQKNDMFIAAAGLSGLLSRYIWVIPPWEPSEFVTPAQPHLRGVMHVGRSLRPMPNRNGELFSFPCLCMTMEGEKKPVCLTEDESDYDGGTAMYLAPRDCPIQMTFVGELVTEERALELLAGGKWLTANDSIILDIDEDYYGVEPAGAPAYRAGVDEDAILEMSVYVEALFCPSSTRQERMVDDFFYFLTQRVKALQRTCDERRNETCRFLHFFPLLNDDLMAEVMSEIGARGVEETICRNENLNRKDTLKKLIISLVGHTPEQLDALAEVGVCLPMSPKGVTFNSSQGAYVCQGRNTPRESATPFHVPTPHELQVRSQRLESLITWGRGLKPRLVTVCRSSRDGYTPRASVATIEAGILAAIFSRLGPEASPQSLHYDPDLFGGKLGWHGRHQGLMGKTVQRNDIYGNDTDDDEGEKGKEEQLMFLGDSERGN